MSISASARACCFMQVALCNVCVQDIICKLLLVNALRKALRKCSVQVASRKLPAQYERSAKVPLKTNTIET